MTTSYEAPLEEPCSASSGASQQESDSCLRHEPFELSCLHAADGDIANEVREIVAITCGRANVVVLVASGEVTLTGAVPERWMQLEIEHATLHVRGVRSVVSRVRARVH